MKHLYLLLLGLLFTLPLTTVAWAQDAQDRAILEKITDKKLRKAIEKSLSETQINGQTIAILRVKDRKLKSEATDQIIYVQARLDGFLQTYRNGQTIEPGDVPDQIRVIQTLDPAWPVHFYLKEYLAYNSHPATAEPQQAADKTPEDPKPASGNTPAATTPANTSPKQTAPTTTATSDAAETSTTPPKTSEPFSWPELSGWWYVALGGLFFLWIQKRRYFKKCPTCGKWNAMHRSGSWQVVDTEASYVTKELKIRNSRREVVRTEECTVPATVYTYRMHRLCKYRKCGCTGEDYIYKKVKREN